MSKHRRYEAYMPRLQPGELHTVMYRTSNALLILRVPTMSEARGLVEALNGIGVDIETRFDIEPPAVPAIPGDDLTESGNPQKCEVSRG